VIQYDTVIVGAGSAGVVLASRLARAGEKVLLLEAGVWATGNPVVDRPSAWFFLQGTDLDWNYSTEIAENVNARVFRWPRGRAVGGSSVINAMIWLRGNKLDYDSWSAAGLHGWSYDDLLPYFRDSEQWGGEPSEFHGTSGEIAVGPDPHPSRAARAFVEAAESAGFTRNLDFNGRDSFGVGFFPHSIRASVRESTATAHFPQEELPEHLTLITGVRVLRLLFESTTCVGVVYLDADGQEHEARGAETIVSAGAVESPKLLLLSGIGPAGELERLRIPVRADLPVGENLQDHVAACIAVRSDEDLEIDAASALGEAGLFTHSRDGMEGQPPDLQFTIAPIVLTGVAPEPGTLPPNGFTIMPTVARPRSRGSVRLRSTDPLAPPIIQTNYLIVPEDRAVLRSGVRLAFEIVRREPLRSLGSELLQPSSEPKSDDEIDELIDNSLMTFFHPSGTCRMGAEDGVVAADLRVRGVTGLSVVDASVIPTIPSTNINAAVIAIAEKAAASRLANSAHDHRAAAGTFRA
jgi:choline dehydrogenase